uniref:Orofacial cleft 1 candidate 1 n=1 Tax=Jaculus jaculus TaxID=51337 RepID=A0A8C5KWP1_JACJA
VDKKFQQKALKQTKQKKYKSAEFLMVKGDREVTEGIGNPAFNTSSPDLSAHQTSKEKVIRHDVLNHTLAAHQQKCRLPACAEPKGNEYSRNYFDPLMEEEINPRQCRMEVSREDERTKEETSDSESHVSSGKIQGTNREAPEARPAVNQECERHAQRDIILLASPLVEQVSMKMYLSHKTICVLAKVQDSGPVTCALRILVCSCAEACKEGAQAQLPCQRLKIYIKCIRSLKDKVPQGSYFLRVSLLDRPGSGVLQEWQTGQTKARTRAVRHGGHFYEVGLCWQESLSVVLPQRKAVIMGWTFLFELVLHRGKYTYPDQVVGWAVFPVCDNNFHVVEGKFKCLLLRGHYDQKLASFRKIEDLICHDLDHWLCNLYFQVNKLPLPPDDQKSHAQLSPELPGKMVRMEEEKLGADNTACGLDEDAQEKTGVLMDNVLHSSQGSLCNKIEPCPRDCDLHLLKEVHGLDSEGHHCSSHSVKKESPVCRPGELEDFPQDSSYLEELEKHRYSVCCSSSAAVTRGSGSGELFKHLYFAWVSFSSGLELAQWKSQGFWYLILLMTSLWFLRLYLHYLGQWLFLQAISTPVTKFHFHPHTVDLCYPTSSLLAGEELAVIVVGPLMLNAVIFLLLLIRWGCQLLFSSSLDALSKLIITMGLWTVLDPLAVFIVDIFLGRFTRSEEAPTADAAKLYWLFVNIQQPPILGAVITVGVYVLLSIITSLIVYLYCLRLNNDSWILDVLQRIHSEETKFFIPHDLEISNQELSSIVKRAEQWRGLNGERRKVAVYDYICSSHGTKSSVSSCDLRHPISASALGPGEVISHVSVYNVYPSGFQELHRHFLRLPDGTIVEVFGDISALTFVPCDVVMAIEEHIREVDTVQRETAAAHEEEWKGTKDRRCPFR